MHAHDLLVDQGDQGHVVEAGVELLPQPNFVAALDFVEEAVNARDGLALVVAAEDNDLLGVADFEGEEEANNFATLLASVDVVAHEEVLALLGEDALLLLLLVLLAHFLEHV